MLIQKYFQKFWHPFTHILLLELSSIFWCKDLQTPYRDLHTIYLSKMQTVQYWYSMSTHFPICCISIHSGDPNSPDFTTNHNSDPISYPLIYLFHSQWIRCLHEQLSLWQRHKLRRVSVWGFWWVDPQSSFKPVQCHDLICRNDHYCIFPNIVPQHL